MLSYRGLGWRFRVLQLALLTLVCVGLDLGSQGGVTMRDRSDRLVAAVALAWRDGLRLIERPFERMRPAR